MTLATPVPEIELFALLMGLLGGLALFLFGMDQLAAALKAVAGEHMKNVLARLTTNRATGVVTGAFVTALVQSSSVTTVLLVGFVSAGLMSLAQSIGVILGANIGSTVTAQIIAFKVARYALLFVTLGFGMTFFGKRERIVQQGMCVFGLGLIFFGMHVMSEAVEPLRDDPRFVTLMLRMESPGLGILAGAVITALIQSSGATTGIVIVLASQGLLTLSAGIALILGANIGTCITALFATIGRTREALRPAIAHVLFNVIGVVIWVGFVDQLAALAAAVSPAASLSLRGAARAAAETPRQIANAHTLFNVVNAALFMPFTVQFARLVEWLVPDKPLAEEARPRARYLDDALIDTPSLALDRARLETLRIADRVLEMYRTILPAMQFGSQEELSEVAAMDDDVDALHGQVATYLGKVGQAKLTDAESSDFLHLMEAANNLENIGDIMETNLVRLGRERIRDGVTISGPTRKVIEEFHATVGKALEAAQLVVSQKNESAARSIIAMKRDVQRLADSAALHEARRLVAREPNRLAAYTIEIDMLENLKRIYYFCKRMARGVVAADVLAEER